MAEEEEEYEQQQEQPEQEGDFQSEYVSRADLEQKAAALPSAAEEPEYESYKPYHSDLTNEETGKDEYSSADEEEEWEQKKRRRRRVIDDEAEEDPYAEEKEAAMEERDGEEDYDFVERKEEEGSGRKRKRTKNAEFCYLCDYGQHMSGIESNKYHQMLIQLMEETYHQRSLKRYVSDVQRYYDYCVRGCVELPDDHPDYEPLIWKKRVIYAHYDQHVLNLSIEAADDVMLLREISHVMRNEQIFVRNRKTGAKSVQPHYVRLLLQVLKAKGTAQRQLQRPSNTI